MALSTKKKVMKALEQRPATAARLGVKRRKYTLTDETHNRIVNAARQMKVYPSSVIEALVDLFLPPANTDFDGEELAQPVQYEMDFNDIEDEI